MTQIRQKSSLFTWLQPGSSVVSVNDDETARVNEACRVSSKSLSLTNAVEEVMSKEMEETWFKSFIKSWRLTFKLDSDHTCCCDTTTVCWWSWFDDSCCWEAGICCASCCWPPCSCWSLLFIFGPQFKTIRGRNDNSYSLDSLPKLFPFHHFSGLF